jgi:hypothetical protein
MARGGQHLSNNTLIDLEAVEREEKMGGGGDRSQCIQSEWRGRKSICSKFQREREREKERQREREKETRERERERENILPLKNYVEADSS